MITDVDMTVLVAQVGFPIAVSVFLLVKGYTQDREFLKALAEISSALKECRVRNEEYRIMMMRIKDDEYGKRST